MSLVEKWMQHAGPGVLGGIRVREWLWLLAMMRFRVSPCGLLRAGSISCYAPINSLVGHYESWRYRRKVESVDVPPPVFVLGHWRQGTTHLHNLLAVDKRFGYPTTYQCCFPHTFLATEAVSTRMMAPFFPPRRPMDNVEWSLSSPQEDEFAVLVSALLSPYLVWALPAQQDRFAKYLTLRDCTSDEVAEWKATMLYFVKKLTFKHGRPLVLKSPTHTARIRLLLELFPDARFVHIRRNPFEVFSSTKKMMLVNLDLHRLQSDPLEDIDEWILSTYTEMYDAYFADRGMIPAGRLTEVSFEALEASPIETMQSIYEHLELPSFDAVEPELKNYVSSIAGYQKNTLRPPDEIQRSRIAGRWQRNFNAWGYWSDLGQLQETDVSSSVEAPMQG